MHLVVPPGGSFREPRRIELDARVLTIGRGPSCDVRVDVPGVDDEHAKISEVALIAVGPDCAIGDVPLDAGQRRLVMSGDEIQIGSVVLAVEGDDPSVAGAAQPRIRVVEGKNFGDELVLAAENREYVIGRNPSADLVLEDREVSREHIKIVRRGLSVYIFDAASTRGSWLGRAAVYQGSRVEWQPPRMLKLGASVLALELPVDMRAGSPIAKASAPMTPPPRARGANERGKLEKLAKLAEPAAEEAGPPGNVVAYHYEAKAPPPSSHPAPSDRGAAASLPPSSLDRADFRPSTGGSRTAWKKTGPTVGRGLGLLLLALAGVAILGVLFVVFSLME